MGIGKYAVARGKGGMEMYIKQQNQGVKLFSETIVQGGPDFFTHTQLLDNSEL